MLSEAAKKFLAEKESTPIPPKEKGYRYASVERQIEEKRAELEIKKLDLELSRLTKPDTSIDYYSKMLELQEKNFNKVLEMSNKQNELKLEIEKLRLAQETGGGDFTEDLVYSLLPLLPEIIKKKAIGTPITIENKPAEAIQGGENMKKIPTAKEKEEFEKAVKAGKISEEEAYKAVLEAYPDVATKITKEQFHNEYEKIKNG